MKSLCASVILSCACNAVSAQATTPVPMPSHFLAIILKGVPQQAPKLISPHYNSQECYNAAKRLKQENQIPGEVEVKCLKIVEGIEV